MSVFFCEKKLNYYNAFAHYNIDFVSLIVSVEVSVFLFFPQFNTFGEWVIWSPLDHELNHMYLYEHFGVLLLALSLSLSLIRFAEKS